MYASLAHTLSVDKIETEPTITSSSLPSHPKTSLIRSLCSSLHRETARSPPLTSIRPQFPAPSLFILLHNHSQCESPSVGGNGVHERCRSIVGRLRRAGWILVVDSQRGSEMIATAVRDGDGGEMCGSQARRFYPRSSLSPISGIWPSAPPLRLVQLFVEYPQLAMSRVRVRVIGSVSSVLAGFSGGGMLVKEK